jgi:hypothetical protein
MRATSVKSTINAVVGLLRCLTFHGVHGHKAEPATQTVVELQVIPAIVTSHGCPAPMQSAHTPGAPWVEQLLSSWKCRQIPFPVQSVSSPQLQPSG